MDEIRSQFDTYLNEQQLTNLDTLINDHQHAELPTATKGAHQEKQSSKHQKQQNNKKFEKFQKGKGKNNDNKPSQKWQSKTSDGVQEGKFQYTVKQSATNEAILNKQKIQAEEKMIGAPSMNFIRKIYNLITHKQEQLEEIQQAEKIVQDLYNGDLKLAKQQIENGNYSKMSRKQLESIDKKHQIQESLDEYLTIFNIYKQFHKKPEDTKTDIPPSKSDNKPAPPAAISDAQVSELAQLITVAQNNTQLVMCISSIIQSQQAQLMQQEKISDSILYINDPNAPQISDVQKVAKFFSSLSYIGSYSTQVKAAEGQQNLPVKYMNFEEKSEHIKLELKDFLKTENQKLIQNSIFRADPNVLDTKYKDIQQILQKIKNYSRIFKDSNMPPNPALNQVYQQNFTFNNLQGLGALGLLQPNMALNQLLQNSGAQAPTPQFQQNFVAQTTQNFTASQPITTQINTTTPQQTYSAPVVHQQNVPQPDVTAQQMQFKNEMNEKIQMQPKVWQENVNEQVVGGVGGAAVGAQPVTVQKKKSVMRDWNEDPHEDEDEEVEQSNEIYGGNRDVVENLENQIQLQNNQLQGGSRDMLEEIQDDTLAFLQSEIDKNQTGEQVPPNNAEGGGLYYGPGSGKNFGGGYRQRGNNNRGNGGEYYNNRGQYQNNYRGGNNRGNRNRGGNDGYMNTYHRYEEDDQDYQNYGYGRNQGGQQRSRGGPVQEQPPVQEHAHGEYRSEGYNTVQDQNQGQSHRGNWKNYRGNNQNQQPGHNPFYRNNFQNRQSQS